MRFHTFKQPSKAIYSIQFVLENSGWDKSSTLDSSNKSQNEITTAQTDSGLRDPFNLLASHANPNNLFTGLPVTHGWRGITVCHGVKLLKTNIILPGQSNKTQEPFSLFFCPPSIYPGRIAMIHKSCGGGSQYAMSERHLGEFYDPWRSVQDHFRCMHVSLHINNGLCLWKCQHTFKEDNLIFLLLSILSSPRLLILSLRIPVKGATAYTVHLGFWIINRREQIEMIEEELSPYS